MSYSIKIGKHSIELAGYAGKVVAPNTQMETLFRGMAGELTNLRVTVQQAEAEADLLDVIRNDPDLNEQAKNRRSGEARNPDTLKAFTRGVAAVSGQAANILDYLMNKLVPVKPLASDDVQGFMRDSEMRQAFGRLDRRSQEKMLLSMHGGKHQELAEALLRAHAVCSGLGTEQLKRLAFSRIASENGQVISAVADLVDAVRKDVAQITAIRTWYNNLIYGKNDDPSELQPRMTGLDQLSEHVSAMLKSNQRQTSSEDKQAA
ncbi:TPA: hypothetical protein RN825_003452 [Escherichia coli]|nr:hypothetical protein [Escherichia coli]